MSDLSFQNFNKEVKPDINSRMMYNKMRPAVKSLGYFSNLLKAVNNQREIENLFCYLLKRCESIYFW